MLKLSANGADDLTARKNVARESSGGTVAACRLALGRAGLCQLRGPRLPGSNSNGAAAFSCRRDRERIANRDERERLHCRDRERPP